MTGIVIRDNEVFEKALRRFAKSCEKSGILSDLKKHQYFEKPSERKKRKLNTAIRKAARDRLIEAGIIKRKPQKKFF